MARFASMALAAWLLLTGLALGELRQAAVPQWVVAAVVLVAELVALRRDDFRWVSFAAGMWLVVAPFVFAYDDGLAALNSYSVGLLLMVLGAHPTHPASYREPTTYLAEIYGRKQGLTPRR